MATSGSVSWDVCERCAADGGIGVRLPSGGSCWAHANDQDLDAALKRLGEDGHLDARGVPLTQDLLERLLAAAPGSDRRQVVLADARFYAAIFQGKANFNNVTFQGNAGFAMATFRGMALFDEVTFQGNAGFEQAQFNGRGWFGEAQFEGNAGFEETVFQADAIFNEAIFQGEARFSEARFSAGTGFARVTFQSFAWFGGATFHHTGFNGTTFQRDARFSEATFQGYAGFREVAFQRDARFREATFQDDAEFNGATFQRDAWFVGATFERARQLGPMLVRKALVLDQAVFRERVQIEVAAAAVCCRRGRFPAGVQLRVRWAQVVLDDADLAAPSILSGVPSFPDLDEGRWARAVERLLPQPRFKSELRSRPRLLSIRRADVAGLTVAAVDLRACRFVGAHHIDQLRVEESSLGYTPRGWRWTTRLTIAEERYWRANVHRDGTSLPDDHATNVVDRRSGTAGHDGDWYGPANRLPAWLAVELPSPPQIAAVYRALRKGREDSRDEPGAADFYYGEMEMRRHDKRAKAKSERRARHYGHWAAATTERAILWLYWLVSGYGLRAWRALAAFAVVIGLVGLGFSRFGFHHPHPSQLVSWLYALQATVSLEGKARQLSGQLTLPGELLRVGLRLTGPVLLGLALLSIRGRVKR